MNWQLILLNEDALARDLFHGFTIGRTDRNHWMIDDDSISRAHARFDMVGNRFFIKDLHSSNGIYLNGERVREMEVFPGDRLQVGEKVFLISSGAQTELIVVKEEGPTLEPRLPEEGWQMAGWRHLARQLLEALEYLQASTSLLGVQVVSDVVVNEIITEKKQVDISSWVLEELSRGPLLLNQADIIGGRDSLVQRHVSSIMAFPLGKGAFVYLERCEGQWGESDFYNVKKLLIEFQTVFCTSLEMWVNRESLKALVSKDPTYKELLDKARKVAKQDVNVIIAGPAGSGKSLLAKWLHEWSGRNDEKLILVDLSLIPQNLITSSLLGYEKGAFTGAEKTRDGYLQMANRGSLVLENFDESPKEVQTLLLKVLEEGEFSPLGSTKKIPLDVRWMVTTRQDLKVMATKGEFREDLFYRLSVIELNIPALDARGRDIETLIRVLLDECATEQGRKNLQVDKEFFKYCQSRLWPGNVREIKNFIERKIVESPDNDSLTWVEEDDTENLFLSLKDLEKQHITKALERSGWNKGKACELLGITRPTLSKKIADYNLHKAD